MLRLFLVVTTALVITSFVRADVTLPAIFSDHRVLPRTATVPVWDEADPGDKVVVSIGTVTAEAVTDAA